MKQAVAKFAIVYGASLTLLFGIALISDHAALIDSVEQQLKQAELRHCINVFAEGTWFPARQHDEPWWRDDAERHKGFAGLRLTVGAAQVHAPATEQREV